MQVTATQAKNRFGHLCLEAKSAPVVVAREGQPDSVIVSYADYQALRAAADKKSTSQRRKAFDVQYRVWLAEQHRIVEEFGVFGEEYRVW